MDDGQNQVDRLLARGYLSGSQYDEIERRVLRRTAAPLRTWRRRLAPAVLGGASLAAALVLWLRASSEFTAKGEFSGGMRLLDVSCSRPNRHQCSRGDTLAFIVSAGASGYLGAYAQRVGDPVKERIWYFPGANEVGPRVISTGATVVLPQGIRIGSEHEPGQYVVTTWLSMRPLSRAEIDRAERSEFVAYSRMTTEILP